jgi:hypothetical protein
MFRGHALNNCGLAESRAGRPCVAYQLHREAGEVFEALAFFENAAECFFNAAWVGEEARVEASRTF